MARNYGQRSTSRSRGQSASPVLVMVVTFLLGYLTASMFDINTVSHWFNTQVLASHESTQAPASSGTRQAQVPPKPKFEFYTLLANEHGPAAARPNPAPAAASTAAHKPASVTVASQASVTAPAQPTLAQVSAAKPVAATQAVKGAFLIQVASFKARQDAEHMKGRLTLKGFDVNVVPVAQPQGNWFRVVVGPFASRDQALSVQRSLAKNEHLNGMLRKVG